MSATEYIFATNLSLLALDHLVGGFLALAFPRTSIRVFARVFGARLPETPEYLAILKPWGALGVFAGLVGVLPIFDAPRHAWILAALAALLAARIFYRLRFGGEIVSMGLTRKRNLFHVGLIAICLSLVLWQLSLVW
jgi:hypothetical protein